MGYISTSRGKKPNKYGMIEEIIKRALKSYLIRSPFPFKILLMVSKIMVSQKVSYRIRIRSIASNVRSIPDNLNVMFIILSHQRLKALLLYSLCSGSKKKNEYSVKEVITFMYPNMNS